MTVRSLEMSNVKYVSVIGTKMNIERVNTVLFQTSENVSIDATNLCWVVKFMSDVRALKTVMKTLMTTPMSANRNSR